MPKITVVGQTVQSEIVDRQTDTTKHMILISQYVHSIAMISDAGEILLIEL